MDAAGVLPGLTGIAVLNAGALHDTYKTVTHALRNTHDLLRELRTVIDATPASPVALGHPTHVLSTFRRSATESPPEGSPWLAKIRRQVPRSSRCVSFRSLTVNLRVRSHRHDTRSPSRS